MTVSARTLRWLLLAGIVSLCGARSASAQTPMHCTNDIDCTGNAACGGDICDWADTVNPMTCKAAGTHPAGMDGWCMADTDCKCHGIGATCGANFSCTFTRPCEADGGTCTGGGTDGGGGGGGGGGGCTVAGSTAGFGWGALLAVAGLIVSRRRRR